MPNNSSEIKVTKERTVRLPDKDCRFVFLSNRNFENGKNEIVEPDTGNDGYKTSENEIYYGYSGETPHPLYPSETTILLPVTNANQIYLRVRPEVGGGQGFRFVAYTTII